MSGCAFCSESLSGMNIVVYGEQSYHERCLQQKLSGLMVAIINGVRYEYPEPLREAPQEWSVVWAVTVESVWQFKWTGGRLHRSQLELGMLQSTEQGAIAHRRAMLALNGVKE